MRFCDSHFIQLYVNEILWQPRDTAVFEWNFVTATRYSSVWMKFCDSHMIEQCVDEILPCIFYILHLTWIKFDIDIFKIYWLSTLSRRGKRLSRSLAFFTCAHDWILFVTYSPHLLSDFGDILCMISAPNALQLSQIWWMGAGKGVPVFVCVN